MTSSSPQERIITDVQQQRKRADRRSIFIDGEFAFGISEEGYIKFALFKGRRLTEDGIEEILRWEDLYQAKQSAYRFLNYRARSRREIEQKLREKGFSEEAIAGTLETLAEYGMMDDAEFARMFVGDRLLKKKVGRSHLAHELRRKGVADDLVKQTLEQMIDDETEFENALAAARKKAPAIRKSDPQKWRRALETFLAGRGFGWETVRNVMETIEGPSQNQP